MNLSEQLQSLTSSGGSILFIIAIIFAVAFIIIAEINSRRD